MKELYRKYKREIWVGVVVSLVTTAILKFGDWMLQVVPKVGNSIFETFSNFVFSLAANYTDNTLSKMIVFGIVGFFGGASVSIVKEGIKKYKSAVSLEKRSANFQPEKMEKLIQEIVLEIETEDKSVKKKSVQDIIANGKKSGKSALMLGVTVLTLYFVFVFFVMKPMSLFNKFNLDILKVAPYISEELDTQLKSDWVCMKSKLDYEEIYLVIDKVVEEYSLPD